ncbi:MAG: ABC transporter permease, partial [Gordonibacter urolithinfaciens]
MLSSLFQLLIEKRAWFFDLFLQHIGISFISIALAVLIGLSLGIAIAQWRRGAKPVLALVNFVYTIPSIALFGFLIPVTGIGDLTAIVALTVYALLPMVRNTY